MRASLYFTLSFLSWVAVVHASPASNATPVTFMPRIAPLAAPAGAGASGGSLVRGPDGIVCLSWVEPIRAKPAERTSDSMYALRFATLDPVAHRWSAAQTIAQGHDWLMSNADFPSLAVQPGGRMTAVWFINNPALPHPAGHNHAGGHDHGAGCHALISQSSDHGASWSPPEPLTRESDSVEFVALQPLADGSVLAAWLDGRAKKSGKDVQQLYARIIGSTQPDQLVDASVCDCCQTTLTGFPDGSAVLAYRGRAEGEIRDILSARLIDGQWEQERNSTRDGWKIAGCPVNGPRIASDGPRVLKVWYTAANGEPAVLAAMSSDAGGVYTLPQRVDLGSPLGRVDGLLLRDGTQLITWVEAGGDDASQPAGIFLRRYASSGSALPPALLTATTKTHASGFPRIALLKDYDATPAELVLVYTEAGEPSAVKTLLVTLPDAAALVEADSACDCAGRGEELIGYPMRGHIVALSAEKETLRVKHSAIPGIMRAGEREFKATPALIGALQADRDVLARIEERNGAWWIFDVRVLMRPKS